MATTVQNPFDTQQASATNTDIGSPASTVAPASTTAPSTTGLVNSAASTTPINTGATATNPTAGVTPQTYNATTTQVNAPTETVQGQVNSILATDNPLMQRARTLATQQMAQRGLVNSSMNAGAGVAAMTDKAMQIGSQDAQTYSQRALANTEATNQASQFNTSATNDLYKFGQNAKLQTNLATQQQAASLLAQTQGEKSVAERQLIDNQAQLDRLGLQINANKQTIPTTFAANIANTAMTGVNSIMADGVMTADTKKAAIANLVTYANSQIAWAEKFYGTTIPQITAPA
jgi:hypothetical protein